MRNPKGEKFPKTVLILIYFYIRFDKAKKLPKNETFPKKFRFYLF